MAKKKVNRKKQLKKQLADLRRKGQNLADAAVHKAQETFEQVAEVTGQAIETVTERVQETVENLTQKADTVKVEAKKSAEKAKKSAEKAEKTGKDLADKASKNFEAFAEKFEGVAKARLETFYEEGIKSAKDFASWTEKELLELKGIGPATIKQLKELGIKLKK